MTSPSENPTPSALDRDAPVPPMLPSPAILFAIALILALFFGVWSWLTLTGSAIPEVDMGIAQHFAAWCSGPWSTENKWLIQLMIYLTDSGGVAANFLVAIIGALWQNATKQRFLAVAWLLIALGGGVMNVVTKHSFDRDRPPEALRDRAVLETNKSYPSGHSMGSAVSYTMLGYVLLQTQRSRAWSLITIVALACVIAAVGFSRIYLRAHWCSDVVGGWTIGLCWVFFCIGLLEIRRRMSVD